ncbi:MAG TPA: hypothetical protein VKS60_15560 [Stellaceae bacterium]|nr:hypothetical protein [Stellaceae bacterium]
MTPEAERERQRLIENPYVPLEAGTSHSLKLEHAAEYAAFYLGEIAASLKVIAERLGRE